MNNDLISRKWLTDAIRNRRTYLSYEDAKDVIDLIDNAPTVKPSADLCASADNEDDYIGDELFEGDTIYLLGVEGKVVKEHGAWGWASHEYVPWDELEKMLPHGNSPAFCYCDNFISFWELKWNFDDGEDWNGVPFIKKTRN